MAYKKVAVITGGTRGIGRAISRKFAHEGCRLAVVYRSDEDAANEIKLELEAQNVEVLTFQADVADAADCSRVLATTRERFGSIDILINNAGGTYDGAFALMNPEEYSGLLQCNLVGPIQMTIAAIPDLIASSKTGQGGVVVMMSSMAGVTGKEGQVPYSATKGGLIGVSRLLAHNLGVHGVRVNALAPGFIQTDMVQDLSPEMYEHVLSASTLPRMGEPFEVANAAWFLTSPNSSYINGAVLRVDGGFLR